MLSILFSLLVAALFAFASEVNGLGLGLSIGAGVLGFILGLILVARLVGKRMNAVQEELKNVMLQGQNRINRDIQHFQTKPGGNPKAVQAQIEKKQQAMIRDSLVLVDQLAPFQKYSILIGRQISTMKMQFHYQLKEFEQVDAILAEKGLMNKPMLSEPIAVGMKMARQYKNKDLDGLEKTFKKHLLWFRGDRASLLYGIMSWVYVKQGDLDEARSLLAKGKDKTGNETLQRNWEALSNDKVKSFSNRGLGDEWYALGLENPPSPKVQRQRGRGKGPNRF